MNLRKLYQTVNYILSKYNYRLNYTKLIKLLYISDRNCLKKYGFSITEDSYVSMSQGIVLSNLYDFIKKGENEEFNKLFIKDGYDLVSILDKKYSDDELSEAEIEILDETDEKYHDKDWKYLVDEVVHTFPEWDKSVLKNNTSKPLEKKVLLKELGKTDEEIKSILETEEQFDQLEKKFKEKGLL